MIDGIDVGKVSDDDFERAPLEKQVPLLFKGIKQTQSVQEEMQETQKEILDTLQLQQLRCDRKFIKKPKLLSIKTIFGAGVFVAGLIYALLEYLK